MRLFSEKVVPTFTSSNLNILTVEDFQEVFFDVFEFEINGKKFVAEKVSEYKGSPVVDVPLVLEGKEFTAPFVLQRGEFEVLFNRDNCSFVKEVVEEVQTPVVECTQEQTDIETIVFEKKEDILREIAQARQSAEKYVEKLKQQKINEAAQYLDEKKNALDREINESKKELLDEFLTIINGVKGEFFEFNEKERKKLSIFIEDSISELADQLVESIEEKRDLAEKRFNKQLNELATNILSGVLLKEISSNNDKSAKDINTRFDIITNKLEAILKTERDKIDENLNSKLNEFNDAIISLEKTNVELNDLINKGDNRALSRIGNVKSQLEETISNTRSEIVESIQFFDNQVVEGLTDKINIVEANITDFCNAKIETAEDKIKAFYDDKISLIEEKVEDLSVDNKQYFLNLINESKQSLLNEIANIKVDVPNIIIEKSNGKQEVDLKGIKSELEKIIGTRFSNELQSLKRLIEMSSGGGSVAKQFANGGTMRGDLNVTGKILSGGVDLVDIFTGGGNTEGAATTLVYTNSANWNNAYNTGTVYQSNSATYTSFDFVNTKFLPLTGGVITGDTRYNSNVTIFGNLTATGTTTFANTVFSVTSALSVVHIGAGPAVWVGNNGTGDIASFYDIDQNIEMLHVGGVNSTSPNVGVKTSNPNKTFTVAGEISSTSDITTSGKIYIQGDGGSDQWQGTFSTTQTNSANWQNTYTNVQSNSANWNTAFNTSTAYQNASSSFATSALLQSTSALLTPLTTTNILTSQLVLNSTLSALSGNWQNTYTNVQSNSANWVYTITDQTIAGNKTFSNNIVGNGTANTLPNQMFTGSSSILTKAYIDSRNSFTDSSQQARLTADGDYQFGVIEYFNDFVEIPGTSTAGYLYFQTVTGSGGSLGQALGDQSSADIMFNLPTGDDNYTSRGVIQPQASSAYNSAIVFAPYLSMGQNRSLYYTQNVAWRVMFAQNDLNTYYRFGVQPPMGGSFPPSFTAQQRALCFDGTVSPNFFFNAPNLRTYTTSFSADTGIPCLTGMWCNIYMDITPHPTTYNTISVIDVTVNYPLSGLRYTYRFIPADGTNSAQSNGWWKQQSTGIVIGQQDARGGLFARKAILIDWIYAKTASLSTFNVPSNWNSTRFIK